MSGRPATLDRSRPPQAASGRSFRFPGFHRELLGGLELLVLQRTALPIFELSLLAPGAGGDVSPSPGLASLAAAALTEGSHRRSAVEFAREAERLGGFVSSGVSWDTAAVNAGAQSRFFEESLSVVAEAFLEAAFRGKDVARLRARRLSEIARRSTDPSAMASAHFADTVYGPTSAYGTPLIGTRQSLQTLEDSDVRTFWESHGPRRPCLVIVGDVEPAAVVARSQEILAELVNEKGPSPEESRAEPLDAGVASRQVHLVDRPEAAQTQLLIGHVGPERSHPDRPALRLLNGIFGGKFSSRINLNLRERHGYTYGAHSSFSARRGPGPFLVSAAVENESVAASIREVLAEIERIRDEPVADEELEDTRRYLLGVQPYLFQNLSGWVSALSTLATLGLPSDWFDRQQDALLEVTVEDVQRVAREHLHPERIVAVAVGPAEELRAQLETFGDLRIHLGDP